MRDARAIIVRMVTLHYHPGNASFAPHVLLREIGVLLLMFIAGLETNLEQMRKIGKTAITGFEDYNLVIVADNPENRGTAYAGSGFYLKDVLSL